MPHPERCFLTWQNPYLPEEWKKNGFDGKSGFEYNSSNSKNNVAPWLKFFLNAKKFCDEN
jgi:phosphoribosylformylglycinamidine synthase